MTPMQDSRAHHACGDMLDGYRAGKDAARHLTELLEDGPSDHDTTLKSALAMVKVAAGLLDQARVMVAERTAPLPGTSELPARLRVVAGRCATVVHGVRCYQPTGHAGRCLP